MQVGGAGAELAADDQPARSGDSADPAAVGDVDRSTARTTRRWSTRGPRSRASATRCRTRSSGSSRTEVNEVAVARAREQELTNNMAKLQGDAARVDLAGVELRRPDPRGGHQPPAVPDLPDPLPRDRRAAGPAGGGCPDPVRRRRADRALAPEDQVDHADRVRRLAGAGRAAGVRGRALGFRLRLPQRRRDPGRARRARARAGAGPEPARDPGHPGRGLHPAEAQLGLRRGPAADPHQPVPDRWRASAQDHPGDLVGAARRQVDDRGLARAAVGALRPQGDPDRRRPAPAAPARGDRAAPTRTA